MKPIIFIVFLLTFSSGCRSQQHKPFPLSEKIIVSSFATSKNIFSIASLDLTSRSITEIIHIVYPYFNYRADSSLFYIKNDNTGVFSFKINEDGTLNPLFCSSALEQPASDTLYLNQSRRVYDSAVKIINPFVYLKFPSEPDWWQSDQTPLNAAGQPLTFICQIDLLDITNHDCRMFVFYDRVERIIKNICQWD